MAPLQRLPLCVTQGTHSLETLPLPVTLVAKPRTGLETLSVLLGISKMVGSTSYIFLKISFIIFFSGFFFLIQNFYVLMFRPIINLIFYIMLVNFKFQVNVILFGIRVDILGYLNCSNSN